MTWNGFQDPLVVRTSELKPILQAIIDEHELHHPFSNLHGKGQIGAQAWLAYASGVSERGIWRIMSGETKHVGLRIVDALLTAADMSYLLQDGTVDVIPNPRLSHERWVEYMQERGCY